MFGAEDLTLDHVQPRMRGGDGSAGNLVTSCRVCNTAKGGQAAWSYLAKRPEQRDTFLKSVAASDERHARRVWPRHVRAVEEAAEAAARRAGRRGGAATAPAQPAEATVRPRGPSQR